MSRYFVFTALLGAAVSMGCAVGTEIDEDLPRTAKGTFKSPNPYTKAPTASITPAASIPAPSDAINHERVITRDCDVPGSAAPNGTWTRTFLTGPSVPEVLGLSRVCAYEWTSPTGADPEPAFLPNLQSWQPDLYVMSALGAGDEVAREAAMQLHAQFLGQVDAFKDLPPADGGMAGVRVYVVDTAPDSLGGLLGPGVSGHGYTVARLIENLTCPSGDHGQDGKNCVPRPETLMGMEYGDPNVRGGYFGSLWSVASAVAKAGEAFRKDLKDGKAKRMVLNLSAGWEPAHGGAFTEIEGGDLEENFYSMHVGISYVGCLGGAVVTSAGNELFGPDPVKGPMYPARWTKNPGWTSGRCKDFLGGVVATAAPPTSGHPFVHTVGGVDGADAALYNARPESTPRIVAPSEHALAVVPKGTKYVDETGASIVLGEPQPTRRLTGTSVSAAVASAAAAILWSYRGSLTADEVMKLVYEGGVDLSPRRAEVGAADPVHRISLCGALAAACAGGKESCPAALPACAAPKAYDGTRSELPGWLETKIADLYASSPEQHDFLPVISTETPIDTYPNAQIAPGLAPQPWSLPECSTCTVYFHPGLDRVNVMFELNVNPTATYAPGENIREPALVYNIWGFRVAKNLEGSLPAEIELDTRYLVRDVSIPRYAYGTALVFGITDPDTGRSTSMTVPIPISR